MPLLDTLCCPLCHTALKAEQGSLICPNRHCYDLSKRGYINFAPSHKQADDPYDQTLFASRHAVLSDGFYEPLGQAITQEIHDLCPMPSLLCDVGCGEGYYAKALALAFAQSQVVGIDISREAITAAARGISTPHWLIGDLKHLPLADQSADVLLNILTPADYQEFARVLKPSGYLLKVIPGSDYLCEVRNAVRDHLRSATYDPSDVLSHLENKATLLKRIPIRYTLPVTAVQAQHFLHMTPMTFSLPHELLETLTLREITIDLSLLVCTL